MKHPPKDVSTEGGNNNGKRELTITKIRDIVVVVDVEPHFGVGPLSRDAEPTMSEWVEVTVTVSNKNTEDSSQGGPNRARLCHRREVGERDRTVEREKSEIKTPTPRRRTTKTIGAIGHISSSAGF